MFRLYAGNNSITFRNLWMSYKTSGRRWTERPQQFCQNGVVTDDRHKYIWCSHLLERYCQFNQKNMWRLICVFEISNPSIITLQPFFAGKTRCRFEKHTFRTGVKASSKTSTRMWITGRYQVCKIIFISNYYHYYLQNVLKQLIAVTFSIDTRPLNIYVNKRIRGESFVSKNLFSRDLKDLNYILLC